MNFEEREQRRKENRATIDRRVRVDSAARKRERWALLHRYTRATGEVVEFYVSDIIGKRARDVAVVIDGEEVRVERRSHIGTASKYAKNYEDEDKKQAEELR